MATLGTIHNHVRRELGLDTDSNLTGDDSAVVTEWANRAVLDILVKTHCRVSEFQVDLTSGTDSYDLDTDILQILEMWGSDGTNNRVLEPITLDEMNTRRLYTNVTTPPVTFYTIQGGNRIIVFPSPGSGEKLLGQYVPRPTAMSAAANDPSTTTYGGIPVEFHDAIELYVLAKAARADDHQFSARGNQYEALYANRLREIRRELLAKRGMRLPIARVGRRDTYRKFTTNDPSVGYLF